MIHSEKSELAGKEVKIKDNAISIGGQNITIEDWWDRVAGKSWRDMVEENMACKMYKIRRENTKYVEMPNDDQVFYGHIHGYGYLIHENELEIE